VGRLSHEFDVLDMGRATYQSGGDKPSPSNSGEHLRKGRPSERCRSCVRRRTLFE
jgi:hypothetical protein